LLRSSNRPPAAVIAASSDGAVIRALPIRSHDRPVKK
jgi:hypothetical protein